MKTVPNSTAPPNRLLPDEEALKAMLIAAPAPPDDMSIEAISLRANYVGPVLEEILHEMETHWEGNRDVETWQDCDDSCS